MVGAYVSNYSTPDNSKLLGSRGANRSTMGGCALPYNQILSMPPNKGCIFSYFGSFCMMGPTASVGLRYLPLWLQHYRKRHFF